MQAPKEEEGAAELAAPSPEGATESPGLTDGNGSEQGEQAEPGVPRGDEQTSADDPEAPPPATPPADRTNMFRDATREIAGEHPGYTRGSSGNETATSPPPGTTDPRLIGDNEIGAVFPK